MRKVLVVLGVLALNGCWWQTGHDPGRSYWNDADTTITPDNVADLELLWQSDVPAATGTRIGAVEGGSLYVANGNDVTALDTATGDVRWSIDLQEELELAGVVYFEIRANPVVVKGAPMVPYDYAISVGRTGVARLDPATGATEPAGLQPNGGVIAEPAVAGDGSLVMATWRLLGNPEAGIQYAQVLDYTYFLSSSPDRPEPGEFARVGDRVLWSLGSQANGFSPACPLYPSPVPPDFCAPDWTTELGAKATAVAKVSDSQAAYTDDSGTLTVLDVATGAVAWTAELGGRTRPAVIGDFIFAAGNGQVAAFPVTGCGAATCTPAWTAPGGAAIGGGDVVYTASAGSILAYDKDGCGAATCTPVATLTVDGALLTPAIVDDGRLFAAANDGRVVAFGLPG